MDNNEFRIEKDTMGEVKVPVDALYGAQTQRSLNNFNIGNDTLPVKFLFTLSLIKKACAEVNFLSTDDSGHVDLESLKKGKAICDACDKIYSGDYLFTEFPLSVFQTGSGTQTNMNMNEVIANIASNDPKYNVKVHPNDDVNKSQSTNDVFPSAMNLSVLLVTEELLEQVDLLIDSFKNLEDKYSEVIKSGRTHLQDATPIKFSQEVSAWRTSLERDIAMIVTALDPLRELAIGGSAVGTGINVPEDFDKDVIDLLSEMVGIDLYPSQNKFMEMSSKSTYVFFHGAVKSLACDLIKIANDIRFLSCGPRTGIGEINIPANEPGSSIMPGKVNPTQCEAIIMACIQVQGNDVAITNAASSGMLELNVAMPLIIHDVFNSLELLEDSIKSFNDNLVKGITINEDKMKENLDKSLMNATVLNPVIGYENVCKVVKLAHNENITLKEACIKLKLLIEEEFDKYYDYNKMV